jgi:hypothetical protein
MFEVRDNHGFGERIELTKTLGSNKVKHIKVKAINQEDNENVKRLKEQYKTRRNNYHD